MDALKLASQSQPMPNTSTSDGATAPKHALRKLPVIIGWHAGSSTSTSPQQQQYLGYKHPFPACQVTLDIIHDESSHTALLKLRIPLSTSHSASAKPAKINLYLFLAPSRLRRLKLLPEEGEEEESVPHAVRSAFTASGTITSSSDSSSTSNILALSLALTAPPTIAAPASAPRGLAPKGGAAAQMLELLAGLAGALEMVLFVPAARAGSVVAGLCEAFGDEVGGERKGLEDVEAEMALERLYAGRRGRVVRAGELGAGEGSAEDAGGVGGVGEEEDGPPSYDELGLSPPPPPPPPLLGEPPAKRQRVLRQEGKRGHGLVDGKEEGEQSVWKQKMEAQVAALGEQIEELRREMQESSKRAAAAAAAAAATTPPPPPPPQQPLEARLEELESQITALRQHVSPTSARFSALVGETESRLSARQDAQLSQLESRIERRLKRTALAVSAELEAQFEERISEVAEQTRHEAGEDADIKIEDTMLGAKVELEEFVRGELEGVEERLKERLGRAWFRVEWDD